MRKIFDQMIAMISYGRTNGWELAALSLFLFFAFQIGKGLVVGDYLLFTILALVSIWLMVLLNLKHAFFILIILIPFSSSLKYLFGLIFPPSVASMAGAYKDILIFFIISSLFIIYSKRRDNKLKLSHLQIAILWFIASCLILFLINSTGVISGLIGLRKTILFASFFFMATFLLKTRGDIERMVNYVIAVGIIVALGTIIQWFLFPETMLASAMGHGAVNYIGSDIYSIGFLRPSSFFQSANVLGFYLAFLASFLFGMIMSKKRDKRFFLDTFVLLVILIALILTLSRGAWLAFAAGFLMWSAVKIKYLFRRFAVLIPLGIIVSVFIVQSPLISFRLNSIFDPMDDSKSSRLMHFTHYWGDYFNLSDIKHLLIGKGLGTTGAVPEVFESKEYKSGFLDLYYLELYQEIGLVGLGSFFLVIYFYLRFLFGIEKTAKDDFIKQIANGLIFATFTFIVSGFFTGVGASFEEAAIFWAFMGVVVVANNDVINRNYANENIASYERLPA